MRGFSPLRASALALVLASAVVAGLVSWAGDAPLEAVRAPVLRAAPAPLSEDAASAHDRAHQNPRSKIRIGGFERPAQVPGYDILDERRNERDGATAARLFVDTPFDSQEEYTLITRDIKARYANFDAVSIEFVDLPRALRYGGGALIFNTAAGADYIGYIYGPPNNKGYYVMAAD